MLLMARVKGNPLNWHSFKVLPREILHVTTENLNIN